MSKLTTVLFGQSRVVLLSRFCLEQKRVFAYTTVFRNGFILKYWPTCQNHPKFPHIFKANTKSKKKTNTFKSTAHKNKHLRPILINWNWCPVFLIFCAALVLVLFFIGIHCFEKCKTFNKNVLVKKVCSSFRP